MPEGFCIFCRTNNIVLSKQEIASCKVIRVNIVVLIFYNIQELSYPEICLKCWQKTTSTHRFDRLSKLLTLSPEMEKDYSRWSNTEAQAIINICIERHKVKILPLFGGFRTFAQRNPVFLNPGIKVSGPGIPNNQTLQKTNKMMSSWNNSKLPCNYTRNVKQRKRAGQMEITSYYISD